MGDKDTSQFDDLLEPLRSLGWTAAMEDDGCLHLAHPLVEVELNADTPEKLRRMLSMQFAPDSAFVEALRQAPDHTKDLSVVGDVIRACRAFSSNTRLPSAVIGVLADNGLVQTETYEWFRDHRDDLVGSGPL